MSEPQKITKTTLTPPPTRDDKRKPQECDKYSEIEKIKRQLHHLIDRVDALKNK